MFSERRQDKDDVYINTMEYCSATKKNEIMPFAATWNALEIGILNEVSQTKKEILYFSHVESKKKKIEISLFGKQTHRFREGTYGWGRGIGSLGRLVHTVYLKWVTNKDLLYSTGISAQYYVTT